MIHLPHSKKTEPLPACLVDVVSMDVHEGTTDLPAESAANDDSARVITQSQSSPTKRTSSPDNASEDISSVLSKSTRKKLRKERKSAKKVRKEGKRRGREEKRMEKELKSEEKRRRKALKKRGRSKSAGHVEANEDVETIENTAPKKRRPQGSERKGRSEMSVSNRYSPRTWNERLEALINFKLEHGHTNVPSRNFQDRGLAEFVVQIRNNPDELNGEQKDKLRDLGFDWTTGKEKKEKAWDENLDRLDKFHKKHKNFAVHRFPEFKKLHGWLLWQRSLQLNGRLRDDRRERLEGIGFTDWSAKKMKKNEDTIPNTWMRQYKNLKVYVRENGHSMVPQHKHTDNHGDRTLANWVRKQRMLRNKDCLSAKKIALLEELNFIWTFDTSNSALRSGKLSDQRKEFDTSLDLLRQYKEENSTIDDVRGSMMIGDRNVGKWLAKQKSLWRTGGLNNDRMVRLEELGVVFE
mmetsp:Transcript_37969/g.92036  ORF Transcript_37969/g.92036 Transcript_37969/m.92036 type:complete len:465 (+) Transcript_37969:3-1397(+)